MTTIEPYREPSITPNEQRLRDLIDNQIAEINLRRKYGDALNHHHRKQLVRDHQSIVKDI